MLPARHVVLLPGLDGSGQMFIPLQRALDAVGHSSQAISYPPERCLDYDDLERFILPQLPRQGSYLILAESFSGPLGLRLGAIAPPGLRGVVLCASFIRGPRWFLRPWTAPLVRPLLFRWPPRWLLRWILFARRGSEELYELLDQALSASPQVMAHRARCVLRLDARDAAAGCGLPLLYLQAAGDWLVPGGNARALQVHQPQMQWRCIAGSHGLAQTAPQEVAAAVDEFNRAMVQAE